MNRELPRLTSFRAAGHLKASTRFRPGATGRRHLFQQEEEAEAEEEDSDRKEHPLPGVAASASRCHQALSRAAAARLCP